LGIRNLGWYNAHEGRPYPLDDSGTLQTDDGRRLPHHLLADLNIRYPYELGPKPFLAAVTVGPALATVTFEVEGGAGFTPLAAASLPLTGDFTYVVVPVQPFAAGVGGWVVFGRGVEDGSFSGRFSTAAQTLLAPRVARRYRRPPVVSLGRLGSAAGLDGVVLLKGQDPIQVVLETMEVAGANRDVIVVRLSDTVLGSSSALLEQFAGPCGARPESGNCGDPQPIETVNGVSPDCNGTINLVFEGCADVAQMGDSGVVLDCALGLATACPPPHIPNEDGTLPDDAGALFPVLHNGGGGEGVSSLGPVGLTTHIDCFYNGGPPVDFLYPVGVWGLVPERSPLVECAAGQLNPLAHADSLTTETGSGVAQRNVAIWDGSDTTTFYRTFTTDFYMLPGPTGALHNAQLVFNFPVATGSPYFVAELSYDTQQFHIKRYSGGFSTVVTESPPVVLLGVWYRMELTVKPGPFTGDAYVSAHVWSASSTAPYAPLDEHYGPYTITGYGDGSGKFGFGTYRAQTRFSFLRVEETL
jgi:hypothetical protein